MDNQITIFNSRAISAVEKSQQKGGKIMEMPETEAIEANVTARLAALAEQYFSAPKTDMFVYKECYNLLRSSFQTLSISEVPEMFRLYAAGSLNANIEAFHGMFNVGMFGKMVRAYIEYRKPILKALVDAKAARVQISPESMEAKNERLKTELLNKWDNNEFEIDEVAAFWGYQITILKDSGRFDHVTAEKKAELWLEAKEGAKSECHKALQDPNTPTPERKGIRDLIEKIAQGETPKTFKDRATVIYGKMLCDWAYFDKD